MKFYADQRILRNVAATLSATFTDQDGVPAEPSDTVTVGITRADGSVLLAGGTATTVEASAGLRTVSLTAAQLPSLDHLTCTWTAASGEIATTHVGVVGAYYFPLTDLYALDGMSGLSDEAMRVARQSVEEMVEERTGWVWCPRLEVETIDVGRFRGYNGWLQCSSQVSLATRPVRALRGVTVDGAAQTLTDWQFDAYGFLGWPYSAAWPVTSPLVTVAYEVGEDRPPRQLVEALLGAARQSNLDVNSGVSPRALSFSNEFGNINYARATVENLFGNPAVDAVLGFHDRRLPGVA